MTGNAEKKEGKQGPGRRSLLQAFSNLEEYIAGSLLLVMVIIAFLNVITRYFLHYSLAFIEEIGVNMFVWVTLLGIAIAFKRGSHLSVVVLRERAPPRLRRLLLVGGLLLSAGLFAVLVYLSLGHVYMEMVYFQTRSEALNIPTWIYLAGVPVFSVLVIIRIVQVVLREARQSG